MITIHGRTKAQGYSGVSDWARIGEAKKIARVPLLANGDIHHPNQVAEALRITGADGVLIARGALGNPWFFREVSNPEVITMEERCRVVLAHADRHLAQYGERGMTTFRKHLAWYFKGDRVTDLKNAKELRMNLVRVSTLAELKQLLDSIV